MKETTGTPTAWEYKDRKGGKLYPANANGRPCVPDGLLTLLGCAVKCNLLKLASLAGLFCGVSGF